MWWDCLGGDTRHFMQRSEANPCSVLMVQMMLWSLPLHCWSRQGWKPPPREMWHHILWLHLLLRRWQEFSALIMQCMSLHDSDLLLSCIWTTAQGGTGKWEECWISPRDHARGNYANHLFLSNVNQIEQYKYFILGNWFSFSWVILVMFSSPEDLTEFVKISNFCLCFLTPHPDIVSSNHFEGKPS